LIGLDPAQQRICVTELDVASIAKLRAKLDAEKAAPVCRWNALKKTDKWRVGAYHLRRLAGRLKPHHRPRVACQSVKLLCIDHGTDP
jgi:hypothetical protein